MIIIHIYMMWDITVVYTAFLVWLAPANKVPLLNIHFRHVHTHTANLPSCSCLTDVGDDSPPEGGAVGDASPPRSS